MASKYVNRILERRSPETKIFVRKYVDIVERIHNVLVSRGMTQKDLANLMEKRESEISKWLSGEHNFTLKSIAKLEAALGVELISVPHTGFLDWKETQVPHMRIILDPASIQIDKGLRFREAVPLDENGKTIAS